MSKIVRVQSHRLENIPVKPPPYREVPNLAKATVVEIETDDGLHGWAFGGGHNHGIVHDFINGYLGPELIGEDPIRIGHLWRKLTDARPEAKFGERRLGKMFTGAMGSIDVALWDIKGKLLGQPVHRLLGGSHEKIPVYITGGAAYGDAPRYTAEELVAEASHLVELGNRHYKNTVGRQLIDGEFAPDPRDDQRRMQALREGLGPDIKLSMDGNSRMTPAQAIRLCKMTEELDIDFFEEPVLANEPLALRQVRSQTFIPIAAAQNDKFTVRDFLEADAIDIVQPNVNNDGGFTSALRIASMAAIYNKPLGHGNGSGPHNIALQAGVPNGRIVEYHYHAWMTYNAVFEEVPQPVDGFLTPSPKPGLGLDPQAGVLKEYAVS